MTGAEVLTHDLPQLDIAAIAMSLPLTSEADRQLQFMAASTTASPISGITDNGDVGDVGAGVGIDVGRGVGGDGGGGSEVAITGYSPLVDLLDGQRRSLLNWAVRLRNANMLQVLLTHGGDASLADEQARTPLTLAAALEPEDANLVSLLLAVPGIDVNHADNDGMTPLMYASTIGSVTTVQLLLSAAADAHLKDNNGMTSLMLAVTRGHIEVVTDLCHAAINEMDIRGWTALHWAASVGGLAACTTALLSSPTLRVSVVGNEGESCLHVAASSGNDKIIDALLSFNSHIPRELLWLEDRQGCSALDYARAAGHDKCASLIHTALERRNGERPPMVRPTHAGGSSQPTTGEQKFAMISPLSNTSQLQEAHRDTPEECNSAGNQRGRQHLVKRPRPKEGQRKQHELELRIEQMDQENSYLSGLIAARRAEVALLRSALSQIRTPDPAATESRWESESGSSSIVTPTTSPTALPNTFFCDRIQVGPLSSAGGLISEVSV